MHLQKLVAIAFAILSASVGFAKDDFDLIKVKDLKSWLAEKPANLFVFDANSETTRKKNGVIPGARLLQGVREADVKLALPENHDAKLVFYCANEQCMASHDAARVALASGYKDVHVMSDGIQGWAKAGESVEKKTK